MKSLTKRFSALFIVLTFLVCTSFPSFAASSEANMAFKGYGSDGYRTGAGYLNLYGTYSGSISPNQPVTLYPHLENKDQRWYVYWDSNGWCYIKSERDRNFAVARHLTGSGPVYPAVVQRTYGNEVNTRVTIGYYLYNGHFDGQLVSLYSNRSYYLRIDKTAISGYSDVIWYNQDTGTHNCVWQVSANPL